MLLAVHDTVTLWPLGATAGVEPVGRALAVMAAPPVPGESHAARAAPTPSVSGARITPATAAYPRRFRPDRRGGRSSAHMEYACCKGAPRPLRRWRRGSP